MAESITVQIQFEMEQIDRLFEFYAGLLADSRQRVPDLIEMTALGSVLHSFYNGVENISWLSPKKWIAARREAPSGIALCSRA